MPVVLPPQTLRDALDARALGYEVAEITATVDRGESAFWSWKRCSRIAERDLDFSVYWLDWPEGSAPDWFHNLIEKADASRRHPVSGRSPYPPPISAMEKELNEKAPKPMTDLERDLRTRLARGVVNNKPSHPVTILRDDPSERDRVSRPSNQEGLPTHSADVPRPPSRDGGQANSESPQNGPSRARPPSRDGGQAQPVDYSRRAPARPVRVDTAGIGRGTVPKGGFRVA
jgi:hypothetical protein